MTRSPLLTALLLGFTACAFAADKPAAELPPVKPGWTLLPDITSEAKVEQKVFEDDGSRIEELRVRGATQKVTVHPKNSKAPSYEILMGDASYELSPGLGSTRGVIGKRVWRVLEF